jgi:hypothetical protein
MSAISAAHVSSVLYKAGHERADRPSSEAEVSGFWVCVESCSWGPGGQIVTVGYQDYDYGLSDAEQEALSHVVREAVDGYAATLREAGYVIEDWLRYDEVRLGLFVMGRA